MSELTVGMTVRYVPDQCYATKRGHGGVYPWVVATKKPGSSRGKPVEITEECNSDDAVDKIFLAMRKKQLHSLGITGVVFVRPKVTWPGVVTAVNEDGTVDIDVPSPVGGVTFHLGSIRNDPTMTQGNTFCV